MSDIITIGQVEAVVFSELQTGKVEARIDTGARTSAIWADNCLKEADGLKVTFFGPGSALYTGQAIKFTEFAKTVVASSNGAAQRRYKVRLLVVIGGRRMRAWFTLADRSQQVYPVLIGRNVLRGKFVVDVKKQSKNLHKLEEKRSRLLRQELAE
jgi:hypothetical protein